MKLSGHLHDPAALASAERAPWYQLIRRLDSVSLAPAGYRAPTFQDSPSSEHLDLVLTVPVRLCRSTQNCAHVCAVLVAAVPLLHHMGEIHSFSLFTVETRVQPLSSSSQICGGRVTLGQVYRVCPVSDDSALAASGAGTVGLLEGVLPCGSISPPSPLLQLFAWHLRRGLSVALTFTLPN